MQDLSLQVAQDSTLVLQTCTHRDSQFLGTHSQLLDLVLRIGALGDLLLLDLRDRVQTLRDVLQSRLHGPLLLLMQALHPPQQLLRRPAVPPSLLCID